MVVEWCRNPLFLISDSKYVVRFFFFPLQILHVLLICLSLINIKSPPFTCFEFFVLYASDLDVASIMEEARTRWLRPNEIHAMLCNHKYFTINVKPMNLPKSNYLLLLIVTWCLWRRYAAFLFFPTIHFLVDCLSSNRICFCLFILCFLISIMQLTCR